MTQPSIGLPGFPALAAVIVRMEAVQLATERVADLTRPGPVLLRLATRGFGITLPPSPDPPPRQPQHRPIMKETGR